MLQAQWAFAIVQVVQLGRACPGTFRMPGEVQVLMQRHDGCDALVERKLLGNKVTLREEHYGMRVDGSHLQGDVRAEAGSTANLTLDNQASLTGRLENVAGLTLNNQGRWNMVEDSQVGSLAMNDGVVSLGEPRQFLTLELGTLSGNGTFIMNADFATGQTDFLKIGTATGSHGLLVGSSGNEPASENSLHIVHADAGDAQFSLVNGPVDLGAFSYELQQRGNDWYLDGSRKIISPSTGAAMALFGTAPTVWYGELSSLRSRMGELRLDERKSGAWVRSYGNKYNVSESSGVAYSQNQQGVSLGADAPLPWGDRVDDFDRACTAGDHAVKLNVAFVGECRAAQAHGQGCGCQKLFHDCYPRFLVKARHQDMHQAGSVETGWSCETSRDGELRREGAVGM